MRTKTLIGYRIEARTSHTSPIKLFEDLTLDSNWREVPFDFSSVPDLSSGEHELAVYNLFSYHMAESVRWGIFSSAERRNIEVYFLIETRLVKHIYSISYELTNVEVIKSMDYRGNPV